MAKTLEEMIGYKAMLGIVETVKGGVPGDVLPPGFLSITKACEGNIGQYTRVESTRKTARLIQYGSPSVRREQTGVKDITVTLLHTSEHIVHEPWVAQALTDLNSLSRQDRGRQEIDRQTAHFLQLFTNLRLSAVYSALATGHIYADTNGNLLACSTDAVIDVDYSIPDGNQNQLDVLGDGSIIDASWNTATTNIAGHIKALRTAARKLTGYPIKYALYGENIPYYLAKNNHVTNLIKGNASVAAGFTNSDIPNPFLGLTWIPADGAFYEDADGTTQTWVGEDTIVFTPEPSADWWEMLEGTGLVPTNLGAVGADAVASLGQVVEVTGMRSYAQVSSDPVTIKHVAADTFLPALKVPSAVFIADVTP